MGESGRRRLGVDREPHRPIRGARGDEATVRIRRGKFADVEDGQGERDVEARS